MAKKTQKPVDLWLPDYYTRGVDSLFAEGAEFDLDAKLYKKASSVVDWVFRRGIECHDPDNIMQQYGNLATVRVANHHDFTDPPVLARAYDQLGAAPSRYAAMAELFRKEWTATRLAKLGGYPVDRARLAGREFIVARRFIEASRYILTELEEPITVLPQGGITGMGIKGVVEGINDGALRLAKHAPPIVMGIAGNRLAALKAPLGARATVVVHEVFEPGSLPTLAQLQGSMQIAVHRAAQYHERA